MRRVTRGQEKLQIAERPPFDFLKLPPEVKYMIFDAAKLVPKKVFLKKRYTGVGGNSIVARIFGLLSLNHQFRSDILGYIRHKSPTFSLSVQVAHAFPLPALVARLELREIEFDPGSISRPKNHNHDCLPTGGTEGAIRKFGDCWTNHHIDELILVCSMDPQTERLRRDAIYWARGTVASAFAPLGCFNMVVFCFHTYDQQQYGTELGVVTKTLRGVLLRPKEPSGQIRRSGLETTNMSISRHPLSKQII
jgi:hypothetical protein